MSCTNQFIGRKDKRSGKCDNNADEITDIIENEMQATIKVAVLGKKQAEKRKKAERG